MTDHPLAGGVAARAALAYAKGAREIGVPWTYHSLVSNAFDGRGAMVGTVVEEMEISGGSGVLKRGIRAKVDRPCLLHWNPFFLG